MSNGADLAQLAETLLARLDEHGDALVRVVRDRVPFYRETRIVSAGQLRRSCMENLRYIMTAIAHGGPADPAVARATGTERADADVPLAAVMDAYRVSLRYMWEQLVGQAQLLAVAPETVLAATEQAMIAHDLFTHEMSAAYNKRLTTRIVRQEAERSALVEAVLTATVTDRKTLWEAADLLGLPTTGQYVVAAADLPRPGREALPGVTDRLHMRGVRSAWRLLPQLQVGIAAIDQVTGSAVLIAELGRMARGRVGLSPPFDDLTEAGRGLDLARLTLAGAPPGPGVTLFQQNPVGIAAASSPQVMELLAADILAPVHALPDDERATLLETLYAWRDGDGIASKAAGRLGCHPNTVRYRLRRVEDLTGRRLARPADAAAICLALAAAPSPSTTGSSTSGSRTPGSTTPTS
ncbi:PucR family transcriptional regulator [Skermania piniformis]|uniref:Helix-turn-helix domain-containing protein n=1 Tax=Skermania pinensis TaxID=39122 RepID=A0ABX8S8X5_9ACTN|nr:helix-turn-helix domain-containing protein [Skermania piniformis]QXQ14305.1 helix-turn-helix domain-containing protein [Skermania piniformis]